MKFQDVRALIFQRGWLTISGAATVFLVPLTLTQAEQGLFFTFLSLAAIQSIFEAGVTAAFFSFIAHERALLVKSPSLANIELLRIQCRLIELVKLAKRWFLALSVIFAVLVGTVGFYFVDVAVQREGLVLHWQTPYALLIGAISLALYNLSRIPILEAYDQIAAVAHFRLRASLLSACALWIGMVVDWGIWALAVSYAIQSVAMTVQISVAYRRLALPVVKVLSPDIDGTIKWRTEILPLQFRLAGSYFCGYFIAQAVVPYSLQTHGLEAAGQVGLMLSVFNALAAIVASYMYASAPKYVTYIAHQDNAALSKLFSKVTKVTLLAAVGVYTLVLLATYGLHYTDIAIARRIASPQVVLWMAIIGLVNAFVGSVATMLRAQRKEPMLAISIVVALGYVLAMAFLREAKAEHLFMTFAAVQVGVALPLTMMALRKSGIIKISHF